ncbi:2'-5' RNA ligase family protein [Couchioplanes caeruleus]|uniref:2'-5' RNA ligase family protein n=1 Tax=Couchioplanes caeruleus TaxID=56438 RepID=UPI003D315443
MTGEEYTVAPRAWDRFRELDHLVNHWNRRIGPPSFYWYLTFEQSPEIHALVRRYQRAIPFPYYDHVSLRDLHVTLDRVEYEDTGSRKTLHAAVAAAREVCKKLPPIRVGISSMSGARGAIGFEMEPQESIRTLRDQLREATLSVIPEAPVRGPEFHAHIAIAYCNSDEVSPTETIEAVEALGPLRPIAVTVEKATLVLLRRLTNSYRWTAISRIPLGG